jgi:hypothetical protein
MADWADQYLAALRARSQVENAYVDLYSYCARLADQNAELQKQIRTSQNVDDPKLTTSPTAFPGLRRVTSPAPRPESPSWTQIRQDLAKSQQERSDIQIKLELVQKELDALKVKSKADARKLAQVSTTVSQLTTRIRDRDEELRGKAKLVESVQDENVTLNLQLNMAEEQGMKLKRENEDLVNRWMARKGREADKLNEEGGFR